MAALWLAVALPASGCHPTSGASSPPAHEQKPAVSWDVPAFTFVDQDDHPFTRSSLRGRVWIADYIFTRCTSACPLLTARLKMFQRKLSDQRLGFVSFSIDPERDDPPSLKAYAALWHADETRWRFLNTTDRRTLRAFLSAMHTEVLNTEDPDNPWDHTERLILIDADAHVRGSYDSTSPDALRRLESDATALMKSIPSSAPSAAPSQESGKDLAASLGCFACHSQARIAPRLEGVAGSEVMLGDGQRVTADAAYLRESIVDPGRKLVAGYGATMPGYRNQLTDAQLDLLVAFLQSLPRTADGAPAAARVRAVDPVCHMEVSGGDGTPRAEYRGQTWFFCSDACKERFERSPATFAPPAAAPQVQKVTDGSLSSKPGH
jgi:protein SCO1/2